MSERAMYRKVLPVISLLLWVVIIFLPLAVLFVKAIFTKTELDYSGRIYPLLMHSVILAVEVSGVAVLLGYIPGRMLGTSRSHQILLLLLLLLPLVLPRYVLYYAWTLLLSPLTELGRFLSRSPEVAQWVGTITSTFVLITWYWSLAALLISQGWRTIDRQIWDSARLDTKRVQRFRDITLPLLFRPLLIAFGVCFILSLSEFATFHLAGIQTLGTELAVMYELTGSSGYVARSAWPVVAMALLVAMILRKKLQDWTQQESFIRSIYFTCPKWHWALLSLLLGVSLLVPLALLLGNINDTEAFRRFIPLQLDELGWSLVIGFVAAVLAYLIALGALSLEAHRWISLIVFTTIFLVMFMPASLIAVALLETLAIFEAPIAIRQSWLLVSAGLASRFVGVALILLIYLRQTRPKIQTELSFLDGAVGFKAWWYVYLPQSWPVGMGTFLILIMLILTELSTTMVLLPAGLPNFAQSLLNQMHYVRDQQVIASCLMIICVFLILTGLFVLILRLLTRRQFVLLFLGILVLPLVGCGAGSESEEGPKIVKVFGRTGRGDSEFMYPRAIDIAGDGTLFIVDKTGRIQRFDGEGNFLKKFTMPLTEAGKPTGMSFSPDGKLYVADTHYHRVLVFSGAGKIVHQFGQFGEEEGCFIYPTDVAFSGDGRIFVSEYGGNDRVSVFDEQGTFQYSFGEPGSDRGQFSRPSALCVDRSRRRLYVADACNHRLAIYDFAGELQGYIGSAGRSPGQLRYPYDLALVGEGRLVVCEYGNNRLQLFQPDGRCLAVYGRPGHQKGELAYPWGVAVDKQGRLFIVDAGNNRIQVWQL